MFGIKFRTGGGGSSWNYLKRKKGSKERRERKGRGEEGSGGWREGRKEKKREEEREELQKRVRSCGKSRFYLGDRSTVHNFSGVSMQTLKERKTR